MSQVGFVAGFFRVVGLLLGAASTVSLIMFGGSLFALNRPPPDPSHPLSVSTYGIVALLQNGAIGFAKMFGFLSEIGLWVGVAMTIVSVVVLVIAILLFVIGNGVAAHSGWARVVALIFTTFVLLAALVVTFSTPREAAIIPGLFVAGALYAIWVLGWRYARP